ncbi:MAG: hypothetical protein KDC46_14090 [Thermoleophilia bacterium]|nr:hypothetical protein [Thermoleophilia bacterium]
MSSNEQQPPSAWRPLIDEWVRRESQLRPHQPVVGESVRVRDAVEVGDHAYVLLSYDVDSPWPAEEDVASGDAAAEHTAVIQAERVRQPWHERDSTRARTAWRTKDGAVTVHEHLLGTRRAYSGHVAAGGGNVELSFEGGEPVDATVVDGWFLAVVGDERRVQSIAVDGSDAAALEAADVASLLPDPNFARAGADAMYFSPLDLRSVIPVIQWKRSRDVVVVATCIEQYDEGGMLRLRIDGIRADDDTFVSWPRVTLTVGGNELPSAVCGEYSLADTISLDIGFRPWLPAGATHLGIEVEGIRGAEGEIGTVEFEVSLRGSAG